MTLVGRDLEIKHLAELIDGIGRRGGALLVTGEAGIGKSALLAEVRALTTTSRTRALTAVGVESERHLPWSGLHQIIHPIRAGIENLPGPQRKALRAALGMSDETVPDNYLVGLAVLTLLSDIASDTPLVLIAEDAHWLDSASQQVLAFVARRLGSEPIVLLATIRDGQTTRLDDGLPAMHLERLTDETASELLDKVAPGLTTEMRSRLLAEAAGNPLALIELPPTVHSELPLPTRLERAFTARFADLPEQTRTCLLNAAVNDSNSLAEALGDNDIAVLTPAVDARLVELGNGTVTFRHPLMRSAIAQSASPAQRQAAHRKLAETQSEQPDRRAWHLAAATVGIAEAVAADLVGTADRAQRRGGVGTAIAALEEAARLSQHKADHLLKAAELAVDSGNRDLVDRLLNEARSLELTPRQHALARWLPTGFDDGLRADTAGPGELAALAESLVTDDIDLAMRILWGAAMRCFWVEPGADARRLILRVADSMPISRDDPRMVAISAYVAPFERGPEVRKALGQLTVGDPQMNRFLGSAALQVGAFDLSIRFSAAAQPGFRAQGRLGSLTRALAVQAWSSARLGDLAAALPAAEEASRLGHETGQPFMHGLARAVLAEVAALRGHYEQATTLAADAERIGLAVGARPVLATVQLTRGIAALGEGRYADAYADLRRVHDPADPSYQLALRCHLLPELAEAAIRADQTDELRELVADLEHPYVRAVLDQSDEVFTEALAAAPGPLERARLQLAFGEWLRRQRRVAESRPQLRAARAAFDALGIVPWGERTRRELRAAGETSPHHGPDARSRLTAHELSIARLAADGLTNREIGQQLFLSHRTVSTHLHRIFPKLGVSSRSELKAALTYTDSVM